MDLHTCSFLLQPKDLPLCTLLPAPSTILWGAVERVARRPVVSPFEAALCRFYTAAYQSATAVALFLVASIFQEGNVRDSGVRLQFVVGVGCLRCHKLWQFQLSFGSYLSMDLKFSTVSHVVLHVL